ncbi:MAG: hypothetical protein QXS02_03360 [Candidatus Thermoplasmatota archaeon]
MQDKKIVFLELPTSVIDEIDALNTTGSRSAFMSELIEKQLRTRIDELKASSEIRTTMQADSLSGVPGAINLVDNRGVSLGRFNINTVEGFERLADKICKLSDDPIVRMKARRWR